jgi:hypothetical protein
MYKTAYLFQGLHCIEMMQLLCLHSSIFFSLCFSNCSPNVVTLTVVFPHERYSQRRLVLLLNPRISKQAGDNNRNSFRNHFSN